MKEKVFQSLQDFLWKNVIQIFEYALQDVEDAIAPLTSVRSENGSSAEISWIRNLNPMTLIRTQRPLAASYFSDSGEDDAPEEISIAASKKEIQKLHTDVKNAEASQKKARKEKNRALDRKLKERSEKNVSRKRRETSPNHLRQHVDKDEDQEDQEGGDFGDHALEVRMERAMQEAQDEEEEGLKEDFEFSGIPEMDNTSNDNDSGADDDDTSSVEASTSGPRISKLATRDEDGSDLGSDASAPPQPKTKLSGPKLTTDRLPDELFAAAFKSTQALTKRKAAEEVPESANKKRRRKSKSMKTVGNHTITILNSSDAPSVPATMPSKKIKKFLDRTLGLKNSKQHLRSKGWERRPVNIGVLRRDGPAASFVRNQ
ncbi:hypothetical protein CPB83DRAFT_855313 [Crepidotus variabilis]|uniref:Uncharacterized protein n=1 Tax=Crepidotus variabilis TaxID=179855 RepID=A0A9P6EEZ2_9AGAR|nr:hypothetical protein CPB83DRAFT_855313 [Crepidotus variabilis]